MAPPSPASTRLQIGASLEEARHRTGLTIDQAAEETKIRAKYLRALEDSVGPCHAAASERSRRPGLPRRRRPRADRLASPRAWVEGRPVRGQAVPARPLELRGRGLLAASRRSPAKAQRSPARLVPD